MTEEKTIWTGNIALDRELLRLTGEELEKLADYARYLRWSNEDENNWADAPLTPEEEAQLKEGREAFARGEYLTLAEFRENQQYGL